MSTIIVMIMLTTVGGITETVQHKIERKQNERKRVGAYNKRPSFRFKPCEEGSGKFYNY